MNIRQATLRPTDVPVALALALNPGTSFRGLAQDVGISVGEAHNAVRRLTQAKLVRPDTRRVVRRTLLQFLRHGVPYAFPGMLGPETRGVPTAVSGPGFANHISQGQPVVWPSAKGSVRGAALVPLFPGAPALHCRNPPLYEALTLIDALRVGQARERMHAAKQLEIILASAGRKRE